ncbi:response regulator [Ketobacter sp. MCCC 1A13808]|uniref:response regulator n=1 Tax=Ketobacter sp. MCCC 1A13808 TaxID=2602738 RepID=UPI0012EB825D|nr:response regulator [Ketobacter sp. MCCC 1A13808]MVF14893.1 response regulator [Ketobacter sp. MCCC 1A13808]
MTPVTSEQNVIDYTLTYRLSRQPGNNCSGPAPEASQLPTEEDYTKLKALIVEDNPVNQKVLAGILKKLNITSQLADNGAEGFRLCDQERFDIIFMDCQMPIMDGFESSLRIRETSTHNRDTPIIAVTANASANDINHCKTVGMDDFLKKPVKSEQIKAMILKHAFSPPADKLSGQQFAS